MGYLAYNQLRQTAYIPNEEIRGEFAADEALKKQQKAQQEQSEAELQKMINDDSVIPIDINDLNL